jgi:hypothetical protein
MVVLEVELSGPCIQSAFEKRPAVFTARAAVSAQPVYFTTYVFLYILIGRVTGLDVKYKRLLIRSSSKLLRAVWSSAPFTELHRIDFTAG